MRLSVDSALELDDIDLRILAILQDDCRASLSRIGELVSAHVIPRPDPAILATYLG